MRSKVGIDLAPIAFRHRAPGTAVHVENQAYALLKSDVEWDWQLIATPRTLSEAPMFRDFRPTILPDGPLSYHVSFRVGRAWKEANCSLGLATAFFCPISGPPVVTNYFDANFLHPIRDNPGFAGKLKWHMIQNMHRFSRNRSRVLFIDSDYARLKMIEHDPKNGHKWVVAPCGYAAMPSAPDQTPSWASSLGSRKFILYVGAFSENKNQRRLIAAWDLVRRRHDSFPMLMLLGPFPPGYFNDVIIAARAKVRYPEELLTPGFVSDEDVSWAFKSAYAYIQPSFAEGFGIPVIQAMANGVPVACSNSTSLPETAGGAAIMFDPSNVEDMARAIEDLTFNDIRRTELRRLGSQRATAFSWQRNAKIVTDSIRQQLELLGPGFQKSQT